MVQRCFREGNSKRARTNPWSLLLADLDVDLGMETIRHPDRFPLRARNDA